MTDVHTPEQRRRNMQAVRASDTKQELLLRQRLRAGGLTGYRKNAPGIVGRPDVAYTRWRVAVFVDGCFWHMCPDCFKKPASNADFWTEKLERNRARDRTVTAQLQDEGWVVLRFWEHEVRADLEECVQRISDALTAAGRSTGC